MFRQDLFDTDVQHAWASAFANQASGVADTDFFGALALAVSVMLLTFAVEWLWKAVRALAVTVMVLGVVAVACAVVVTSVAR